MRALKILVAAMGGLIVVGVAVLVTLVADRSLGTRKPAIDAPVPTTLSLPPNARVVETRTTDDRVVLRVETPGEPDHLYLLDHHTGAVRAIVTLGGPGEIKP